MNKAVKVFLGVVAGVAGVSLLGTVVAGAVDHDTDSPGYIVGSTAAHAAASVPLSPSTAGKSKPAAVKPAILGDDLVHVGEDVSAGTYRTHLEIEGGELCYWLKSRDAEGASIIDNGDPQGGRPQVTLKVGQWFSSQGCPDWYRVQ